jgi:hypothetical protein
VNCYARYVQRNEIIIPLCDAIFDTGGICCTSADTARARWQRLTSQLISELYLILTLTSSRGKNQSLNITEPSLYLRHLTLISPEPAYPTLSIQNLILKVLLDGRLGCR